MAPKRPDPKDEPPAAFSSEDEEETTSGTQEETSGEEEDDDDEETQTTPTLKNPPVKKPVIAPPSVATTTTNTGNQSSESGESESDESETDSDSAVPNVKPIATKPIMDENTKSKQSAAKPAASATKSTAKRPAEPKPVQKETKRTKKDSENGEEEGKKTGDDVKKHFQRVWSEEEEIVILKGMIEFSAKKGTDPTSDMNAFHEFIKDSLQHDCTRGKLLDKIRRLKKKYVNYVGKGKEDGFTKPHEEEAYKLSKMIWGNGEKSMVKAETPVKSKAKPTPKKNQSLAALPFPDASKESKTGEVLLDKRIGVASIEEEVVSRGLDMIGGEKKAAMEERWRKLRIAELELYLQRNQLVAEQAKLLLDHYKSGKN
ncbi:hypothetical protein SLA2020_472240 [Shorea laevis]